MKNMLDSKNDNILEIALGLRDKTPVEQFYENPCGWTLNKVPKRFQSNEMLALAVSNEGMALKSISSRQITKELCDLAVENNGLALQYVPIEMITHELVIKAVSYRIKTVYENYPIYYVPSYLMSDEIVLKSLESSPCSLKNVPKRFRTKDYMRLAVSYDGNALEHVPKSERTKEICQTAFDSDPFVIKWIPKEYITREMCLKYISSSCNEDRQKQVNLDFIPDEMRNDKTVLDLLIQKVGAIHVIRWNDMLLNQIEKSENSIVTEIPLSEDTVQYFKSKIPVRKVLPEVKSQIMLKAVETELPTPPSEEIVMAESQQSTINLLQMNNTNTRTIYYITDIHIENQMKSLIDKGETNYSTISNFIREKISEMLSGINSTRNDILLIGGDVSHYMHLSGLFYQNLLWTGTVISVLGNHELWDGHSDRDYTSRPIEDIINDYRKQINLKRFNSMELGNIGRILLQNAIYIEYKGQKGCVIEEEQILNSSDNDLTDICSKCSLIVLGGIGFSGLNSYHNAEKGLYLSAVTSHEQDKELSKQFYSVYEKLNRCAGDKQVIVLTHTPVWYWTNKPYNPNWVYINGHTHSNSLIRKEDGTTVLSDNQIGYKPTKWKLNRFTVSGWYDPFGQWQDGIYEITSEMYQDFNRGRVIKSNGCNYNGKIYALKRGELYMFLLKSSSSLCLLAGGQRSRLDCNNVNYFYENMEAYAEKVRKIISPYYQVLKTISEEIKRFGGRGIIHGCIIDINFYCHVYVNPFDKKVTFYFAYDPDRKIVYNDLSTLLKERVPELVDKFLMANRDGLIPILNAAVEISETEAITPSKSSKSVWGREIYKPSRSIRSIQYILENNVIRIWEDKILTAGFDKEISVAEIEEILQQIDKT